MSSHRSRLQYEQQKRAGLPKNDSTSSLRSGGSINAPLSGSARGPVYQQYPEPANSVLSGSYLSSKSRSQLSGSGYVASGRVYTNLPNAHSGSEIAPSLSGRDVGADSNQITEKQNFQTGSVTSYQPSTMMYKSTLGQTTIYAPSHFKMSRSLKASKASMASYKSGRTTIQAEYHDRKVQRQLRSVKYGPSRKLYWISVAFFTLFLVVLFIGLLIICLRHIDMSIVLSLDFGEMLGPLIIVASFLFLGLGFKFYYDAYRIGLDERTRIKYKAASPSTVVVTAVHQRETDTEEKLVSGQTSKNALSRAPLGSRTTLNAT